MDAELFWNWLDKLSIAVGLITVTFSIMIWFKVRIAKSKIERLAGSIPPLNNYKEKWNYWIDVKTENPVALCLSLIENRDSIKNSVERFLQLQNMNMKTVDIKLDGIRKLPDDIEKLIQNLRRAVRSELENATEVRLFIQGPVQAAALVGGILDNWGPVILYQFDKDRSTYEYWGPLVKN
jgi:low affinity Fe/Cu permease